MPAEDGYYWVLGRMDDIINVSGHRIGTAEVESALVAHPACAEAAAIGHHHPIKGLAIYVFVTPVAGAAFSDALRQELRECGAPFPPVTTAVRCRVLCWVSCRLAGDGACMYVSGAADCMHSCTGARAWCWLGFAVSSGRPA